MATKSDLEKIIADNPNVDAAELKKAEEVLKNLNKTGSVKRSTYGLETPESKKDIRHGAGSASATAIRRIY